MKKQFSEAIKFDNGTFRNLEYHQRRMDRTLREFGGESIDLAEVLSGVETPALPGTFKCRIVYGERVEKTEFIPYCFKRIVTVGVIDGGDIEYGYKYTDRSRLDDLLRQTGCDDMIVIRDGCVTDAFSSNLVFESEDGLFTPETFLLPGTKRQFLLDTGVISERPITAADIVSYTKIRFINAMTDLEDDVFIETSGIIYV